MISKTSVISFVIVLLAISSYCAPIEKYDSSKPNLTNSKDEPAVNESKSKSEPTDPKNRSSEEKESDEMTTERVPHPSMVKKGVEVTSEEVTRPSRSVGKDDSDEFTTERVPRPSMVKKGVEVTSEEVTRPSRSVGKDDSDEFTTERAPRPSMVKKGVNEVTSEEVTRPSRNVGKDDSDEFTTERIGSSVRRSEENSDEKPTESFTHSPRGFVEDSFPSSTVESKKRTVEDFLYTTLESSTDFNKRAVPTVNPDTKLELSSPFPSDSKEKKSVDDEPSSVQSFGKSTGLLKDQTNDRLNEESGNESSEQSQQRTKSLPSFPVQHQSNSEKTKSDN